jgi:CelD/BcsL family acetyltransferase involved in cellulose biosynthesis
VTDVAGQSGAGSRPVRVLTTILDIDQAAESWHTLWDRCRGARTPFLSFEWVRTWASHYAEDGSLYVIIVNDGEAVVGIMPLVWTRYRIGPFLLTALETAGSESRNLIALVAPGAEEVVARNVATHLAQEVLARGRVLRLALVPSDTPFLHELDAALSRFGSRVAVGLSTASFAPYVPLPAVWEDFQLSLGRRRRKVLGRAQRKLDRLSGEVRVRTPHLQDVPRVLQDLFRLHEERWAEAGIRGLFHDERSRAFHLDIAGTCDRLGWLEMSDMQIDGTTVSAHFVLALDGAAYLMRSGRDIRYADYDVGHLHEYHLFRQWIALRLREVDFLRGAEPYKFYWTRNYRVYNDLLVVRNWSFGAVSLLCARSWLRLSRFLSHRHPPREVIAYIRARRATRKELRNMGITLRA